jgi:serine protease
MHHRGHKYLHPRSLAWAVMVLAVALSALPMARVWLGQPSAPSLLPGAGGALSATHIVVDLSDDASPSDINAFNLRHGLSLQISSRGSSGGNILRGEFSAGPERDALLRRLKADPLVQAAEPEVRFEAPESSAQFQSLNLARASAPTSGSASDSSNDLGLLRRGWRPNDALYPKQWNFRMVGAERAWTRSNGAGIVVAVLDTGIAARSTARGKRARDFDKTDFVDGYDFVNDDDDPYDDHGHGTHVAGTIAESTDNREGAAGLAYGASLMPLKVLSAQGYGSSADIAQAMRWAVDNGADVLNLSLGSAFPSEVVREAVRYARKKGALIVCAAGNGFGTPVGYPAAFPGCVAVSVVGPTGQMAFYSSYGSGVALAAPGGDRQGDPDGGVL